jgi:hypothetical protein
MKRREEKKGSENFISKIPIVSQDGTLFYEKNEEEKKTFFDIYIKEKLHHSVEGVLKC